MNSIPREGYTLHFLPEGNAGTTTHQFGGRNDIAGAWCPNCKKPLLLLLKLDSTDMRLLLDTCGMPTMPLLFCWTCNVSQSLFSYIVEPPCRITLIEYGEGGCVTDFPYVNYPAEFPRRSFVLEPVPPDEAAALEHAMKAPGDWLSLPSSLQTPRHQIGGQPLLYTDDEHVCPVCAEVMPLLGVIGDDAGTPRGIVGNPYVQTVFHLCRACRCVLVYQSCD